MSRSIRNLAIIAHVDHGKTTLVDTIIHAAQLSKTRQANDALIMDNNDLERERGITILSKNISVQYKGIKLNIIDTPGHADFGGEVERVLKMADGFLLLVDAFEGVMPQTRFVLGKALGLGLTPIVVVNKLDKPNCRPDEVHEAVFDLMFQLNATEEQLDFTTVYGSSKQGWMSLDPKQPTQDIVPLLDAIVDKIPAPVTREGVPQFQITSSDYSTFSGRIAIGRVYQGALSEGATLGLCRADGQVQRVKINELHVFEGFDKVKVSEVPAGEICAVTGLVEFDLGDTLSDITASEPLPRIAIEEPTMNMLFTINTSPFGGKEGKFVTSRHLRTRLEQEATHNLALRVVATDREDQFLVFGRGVLHLSILIETMRREGYELQVGQPQVVLQTVEGKQCEPIEMLVVDVPDAYAGKVIELVAQKKGNLLVMEQRDSAQHLEFEIPARGLIGLRNQVLTATTGEAVMNHRFERYAPYIGQIPGRTSGALIAMETGTSTGYAMFKLQDRGSFFIAPGEEVYEGQVIGEHSRGNDLVVNVLKGKKLTNMRAAGSDQNVKLAPPRQFSLEEALEYIQKDEYVEITPSSIRLRKIHLTENDRKRAQ